MVPTTRVLLVRHGQSTWNAAGRWQGQADPPLSALGEDQAGLAAHALEGFVDVLWSSDLRRALGTATILGRHLELAVRPEPLLRERHAGAWEGLTRAEIDAGWPGHLDGHLRPPGFELDDTLMVRAGAALESMAAAAPGACVVAVTHGGLVRAVERSLGVSAPPVPNLGGRWIEVGHDAPRLGERIVLVGRDHVTVPGQI